MISLDLAEQLVGFEKLFGSISTGEFLSLIMEPYGLTHKQVGVFFRVGCSQRGESNQAKNS
jgi:hypothetical protein